METVIKWIPALNFIAITLGFLYGVAVLKTSLQLLIVKVERLANLADNHEQRISHIEGHLGIGK